jgi:hypothetical protein
MIDYTEVVLDIVQRKRCTFYIHDVSGYGSFYLQKIGYRYTDMIFISILFFGLVATAGNGTENLLI